MRIGILANSLPAAVTIYDEVRNVPGAEVLVLLAPVSGDAKLSEHVARFVARPGRRKSLELISKSSVVRLRKPFPHPDSIARLKALNLDIGLHKSGNIYRRDTIDCFRLGILNAHIGLLPKYRGRSVVEWSLIQGDPTGISVFFLDEGIDTGERIVFSEMVDVSHCKTIAEAKQHLFDQDARFYRRAIELLQKDQASFQKNDASGSRYYVMSKLFSETAEEALVASDQRQPPQIAQHTDN